MLPWRAETPLRRRRCELGSSGRAHRYQECRRAVSISPCPRC